MNRKQLTTLIILGALVCGLGIFLYNKKTASWKAADETLGQKILKDFPSKINDVAQVRIRQPQAEVNINKQDDQWKVAERWNYPANFSEISDLLRKLSELKSVQTLKVGPSQYGRLELVAPGKETGTNAGTLLEFKDKSAQPIRSLLLGKKYVRESQNPSPYGGGDFPVGRYVAVPDSLQNVFVVNDPLSDVEAKPEHWLNKDFFKVEKLRSISVTSTNATNSWKLTRETETGEWTLADKKEGEEFDKGKASSMSYALSSPSFNDVASPEAKPEDLGMDKATVAMLETFDNFAYTIKAAKGTNDENYHLSMAVNASLVKERTPGKDEKPEDKEKLDKEFQEKVKKLEDKLKQEKACEKWTYVVSKWTIDPLLKERKDFLTEKKPETPSTTKTDGTSEPPLETKKAGVSSSSPLAPPLFPPLPPSTKPPEK